MDNTNAIALVKTKAHSLVDLSKKLPGAFRAVKGLFPLTWASVILVVLMYYAWFWEVGKHANQVLYTIVMLMFAVWCLLIVFTVLSSVLVYVVTRNKNNKEPVEIQGEVEGHMKTGYRIFCPFFLPLVTVETSMEDESFIRHPERIFLWEHEWLEPTGRGRFKILRRRVKVQDIFGLTALSFVIRQDVSCEILPSTGQFHLKAFQTNIDGEGISDPTGDPKGELVEMRRYQAGDPLKLILWKVFARSRKLVVRAPEPAIVEQNDMFVYFVSGPEDESSATLARTFLTSMGKTDMELSFAADGSKRVVSDETKGVSDVVDSVEHRGRGGEDLMSVAPLVSETMIQNCFLLVPKSLGVWMEAVKKFVARYHVTPTFIVSVDGKERTPNQKQKKRSMLKRILTSHDKFELPKDDVEKICEELSHLGTVRMIDVSTGALQDWTKQSDDKQA